jgi:hypothetical protein
MYIRTILLILSQFQNYVLLQPKAHMLGLATKSKAQGNDNDLRPVTGQQSQREPGGDPKS